MIISNPQPINSLAPERYGSNENKSEDLNAVAEQFEALFIQQILKQGRSAKLAEDILGGEAVDTYTSMLDQERATQLSKTVNLGIAEALVSQFEHLTSVSSDD